jgi:CxxC-x17-CxxC domain-containing protein
MEFVDRQLTCMDCSQPFTFTAGEQEFYERKGFKEEPKRCKPCRDQRKSRRNNDILATAPSDDDDAGNRIARRGPRQAGDFGAGRAGRGAEGAVRELFDAVCAQCGAPTRVPFRPIAGRPVYCRECYSGRRGVGS